MFLMNNKYLIFLFFLFHVTVTEFTCLYLFKKKLFTFFFVLLASIVLLCLV